MSIQTRSQLKRKQPDDNIIEDAVLDNLLNASHVYGMNKYFEYVCTIDADRLLYQEQCLIKVIHRFTPLEWIAFLRERCSFIGVAASPCLSTETREDIYSFFRKPHLGNWTYEQQDLKQILKVGFSLVHNNSEGEEIYAKVLKDYRIEDMVTRVVYPDISQWLQDSGVKNQSQESDRIFPFLGVSFCRLGGHIDSLKTRVIFTEAVS